MTSYGPFEVSRELNAGQGTVVYAAKAQGSTGPDDRMVKVFSTQRLELLDATAGESLEAAHRSFLQSATETIAVQRQASASPHVVPVLAQGEDEASVWFVTPLPARTVETLIRMHVRLSALDILQIMLGATRGALALLQSAGRAHGDLSPAKIHVAGSGRVAESVVQVTEPRPPQPGSGDTYVREDLRALGRLLYQMVMLRAELTEDEWSSLVLPLEATEEWIRRFGSTASRWVALCNRLLDPQLTPAQFGLAELELELASHIPKRRPIRPKTILGAGVALLIVAAVVAWYVASPRKGQLTVTVTVPEATLTVTDSRGGTRQYRLRSAGRPLEIPLRPGAITLEATAPGLDPVRITNVVIQADQTTQQSLGFRAGSLIVETEPAGAKLFLTPSRGDAGELELGTTPYTNRFLAPQSYQLRFTAPGYDIQTVNVTVAEGSNTAVQVKLPAAKPGTYYVQASVQPTSATLSSPNRSGRGVVADKLPVGPHVFTARLAPGPAITFTQQVTADETRNQLKFVVPYARLEIDSLPPGANVLWLTNDLGPTPVARDWPPGEYTFDVRLAGYATNRIVASIQDHVPFSVKVPLEPLAGISVLTANLPGTRVRRLQDASLAWQTGPDGTPARLPAGTNVLIAEFGDPQVGLLPPITNTVVTLPAQTNAAPPFLFPAGIVVLQLPPTARVLVGELELTNRPIRRYQAANATVRYSVSAPHSEPASLDLTVRAGETLTTNIVLAPKLYEVFLDVIPAAAHLSSEPTGLTLAAGRNRLPWGNGRIRVSASLPRLQPATAEIELLEQGVTQRLALAAARVSIDTTQKGLRVFLNDEQTELGVTPLRDLYLPPGSHRLTFAARSRSATNTVVLTNGQTAELHYPYQWLSESVTNSLGMPLVYVASINAFVSQFEVSYGQYNRVASAPAEKRGSDCTDDGCPVVNVSWDQAVQFCQQLTARDADHLRQVAGLGGSWTYDLPSEQEWMQFAPPEDSTAWRDAVFNSIVLLTDPDRASRNRLQLYDTYGNVSEFCRGPGGTKLIVGGDAGTTKPRQPNLFRVAEGAGGRQDQVFRQGGPRTGFRVVLKAQP